MGFGPLTRLALPRRIVVGVVLLLSVFLVFVTAIFVGQARNMSTIRDTISTSRPGVYANHTVEFRIDTDIPAGGYITIRPDDGAFTIPTSTFSHSNAELYVKAPLASSYVLRPATTTPGATDDGVTIVSGTSGSVTFTLNNTTGITSGSSVRVLLGDHTSQASTTLDTGFLNPSAPATYSLYIDAGGTETANARAMVAIIDQVGIGPLDTTEFVPPYRFNGAPTGELSHTATALELSLETDELANCRYSTASGTPFYSMSYEFSGTGSLVHTQEIAGFTPGSSYSYFVRCIDDEGNLNTDDYVITFNLQTVPVGNPGTGSTTGDGGSGTGTGSGSSGSGSGSSSGGGSGGGSGGSGGGSGSNTGDDDNTDGGGGFESGVNPYPSGDAQVVITGYAFPGSTMTILVDGTITKTVRANTSGVFTATIEAIARGTYTFGVYATDVGGVKSSTFSTSFSVIGARSSSLSNVHIMPTIKVNPNPVEPGQNVNFSGYAIPNSTVEVENQRQKGGSERKVLTATSDASGKWSIDVPTNGFARDTWKVRAKSTNTTTRVSTQYSGFTFYGVGQGATKTLNSDLNRDGKVNLVDFSILLFHWNTDGGRSDPPADINQDGRVTLTDFSIMIFNWTG
ncbi:MAG: hypothetical protein RLZZ234_759 [Candidatus Parcubacteria bacterium]